MLLILLIVEAKVLPFPQFCCENVNCSKKVLWGKKGKKRIRFDCLKCSWAFLRGLSTGERDHWRHIHIHTHTHKSQKSSQPPIYLIWSPALPSRFNFFRVEYFMLVLCPFYLVKPRVMCLPFLLSVMLTLTSEFMTINLIPLPTIIGSYKAT